MGKSVFLGGIVMLALIFVWVSNPFSMEMEAKKDIDPFNKEESSFVVLELFTSQGCSSCPAADALLEKVKNRKNSNIFALSYHVDYWNYIGWKDPFSKSQYAKRQRRYNDKFRNRSNYTPQLVVNGKAHFVGSDARKLNLAIDEYLALPAKNDIVLGEVARNDDDISFSFKIGGEFTDHPPDLRALLVLDHRVTEVKRGENKNRTLSNSNIVIAEKYIEIGKQFSPGSLKIPDIVRADEKLRLILVLENQELDILSVTGSGPL